MKLQDPVNCEVCDNPLKINWTDTQGVGSCELCSAPYIIYQYDIRGELIDREPLLALTRKGLFIARKAWIKYHRAVWPHLFDEDYYRFLVGFPYKRLLIAELINVREIQAMQQRTIRVIK